MRGVRRQVLNLPQNVGGNRAIHCQALTTHSLGALLASGQINMRKIDGWHTLATKPIDQPIDLAA